MRIILFGNNGQVGWELSRSLHQLGDVVSFDRSDVDFTIPEKLRDKVREAKPDIIVNAVAYTAVDKAEDEEMLAFAINADATGILAEEAAKTGALLVHYSTDYVFDGTKKGPYSETDEPNPINAYGRTKLAGEKAVEESGCDYLIFRTSWVYSLRGNNFLLTMLRLIKEKDQLSVVDDQVGAPTSAKLISDISIKVLKISIDEIQSGTFESGTYNLAASGYTSWHGFSSEILRLARERSGEDVRVAAITALPSSEYPTNASRPLNSRLSVSKLESKFNLRIPDWRSGLAECLSLS